MRQMSLEIAARHSSGGKWIGLVSLIGWGNDREVYRTGGYLPSAWQAFDVAKTWADGNKDICGGHNAA